MIPGQNLKCQNPADIYLLLKSSDFISHDLDHAFDECVDFDPSALSSTSADTLDVSNLSLNDSSEATATATSRRKRRPYSFELVLKKWFDMPKSQEWRCFVRDRQLIGKLSHVYGYPRRSLCRTTADCAFLSSRHLTKGHNFLRFPST